MDAGRGNVSVVDSIFFNNLAGSDNVESGKQRQHDEVMERMVATVGILDALRKPQRNQ